MSYYEKYLLYKKKYLSLKAQCGGAAAAGSDPDMFDAFADPDAAARDAAARDAAARAAAADVALRHANSETIKELIERIRFLVNKDNNIHNQNSAVVDKAADPVYQTINADINALEQQIKILKTFKNP